MTNITERMTIINNNNNKAYHSFNSYTRPKRVTSNRYSKPTGVKIVNLDPTDDPDKVCEAYRQIKIADQNRRIQKNKARLAEKRRLAVIEAEKEKQVAIRKREVRMAWEAKRDRESDASIRARARRELILKLLLAGKPVSASIIGSKDNLICKDVGYFRSFGHDIVAINAAGSRSLDKNTVCMWSIDNFKRPKKPFNDTYLARRHEAREVLEKSLLEGYLINTKDFMAASHTIRTLISDLRKEGWSICTVKNSEIDDVARGWILPTKSNGLKVTCKF